MTICLTPTPAIEREYTRLHRSEVHELVGDEGDDQPLDGAYVYNGRIRIKEVRHSLVHTDEIPNIIASIVSDGWALDGQMSIAPLIQGSDFHTVSFRAIKGEAL